MKNEQRKITGAFPVIQVSGKASEIVADIQQADFEFATATEGQIDACTSKMNSAKHALVEYLELLESRCGIAPTVTYRF